MPHSIFDREVSFKMENLKNPFAACNIFSQRAREVNSKASIEEKKVHNPTVRALNDYTDGRIEFVEQAAEEDKD